LNPSGFDKHLTLYTAPTTAGVATVACSAAADALAGLAPACDRVATALKLTAGKSYPLGSDKSYAAAIDKNIGKLNARVRVVKAELAKATKASGQAHFSAAIASAYGATAGNLGKLVVSPAVRDTHLGIVRSLRRTESDYRALSGAAAHGRRSSYNSARKRAAKGERSVNASLARLKKLGYAVR
jgi:hypothetical protein